jgi:hypothetical protein
MDPFSEMTMRSTVWTLALGLGGAMMGVGRASAKENLPAAFTSLQTMVQPILKLTGPGRTLRTCGYAPKMLAGAKAMPKTLPIDTAVDAETWRSHVETLVMVADNLNAACNASDMKFKDELGTVHSVDDLMDSVGAETALLADEAKPRNLPPAMKSFQTTLQTISADKRRKSGCKGRDDLATAFVQFSAAPPGANAGEWGESTMRIASHLDEMKHIACPVPRGESLESFNSGLQEVHDAFYDLVRLVPAQK